MALKLDTSARLNLGEKLYLPQIVRGLLITFKHIFRKKVTMQYPEEKWPLPDGYRGIPVLVKDQNERTKCVACFLCEFICPPLAITIKAGELPEGNKVEKYPEKFQINMLRCIMCGLCEEVCPEEAIFLSRDFELAGSSREEMIFQKEKLLALGGIRPDPIQKWAHK
ncbi:MAG: NuoI/complex I 23 kDa subunit family protein [Acidobacteriota bacterium]